MAVTLAEIIRDVNSRSGNQREEGSASITCDGSTDRFHLPDRWIEDDGTMTVYLVGDERVQLTEGVDFDMNWESGWIHLLETPAESQVLDVFYTYHHWPLVLVTQFVNNGLDYLYPEFYRLNETEYVVGADDEEIVDDEGQPAAGIIEVEIDPAGGGYRLTPFRDFRVNRRGGDSCYLRLFNPPVGSVARLTFATRPRHFQSQEETLDDLRLPDRIREPLVLYTLWHMLSQQIPRRARSDVIDPASGQGTPTFRDQVQSTQLYKMLLDIEVKKKKMRSWVIRGI